ncbi:USP6 N-terminal-like protein isoform X2 [Sitodiplosis mosellana]|uniref:USP6 N-terminal-like protein isoform X2 n=1 Tax=Sitodiplosis mosellana TaxID=263140 RepID=UPI002445100C|nr:USP6 N-terminal-like protein isoform X2 [Sitodiplosis mosellana]XP_055313839.1 USP6 N-terminal-like protein isoform X2 [Sitodiplosis mosellana]
MNMNENELLLRAKEERDEIFERYDKGREDNSLINLWEETKFEVYHRADRYGFIQNDRNANDNNNSVNNNQYERNLELSLIREKKWLNMLRRWDKVTLSSQEKLRRRIYKGIPNKLRPEAWKRLLNIDEMISKNAGVYQQMLKLARTFSTETRQIDFDVNRQFREHVYYCERYSTKQRSLFNVLIAYSMYNMELGYCQGMAGVAGILLMYMDEEEAFWALSIFMCDPKYAMHGLFIEGFPKLQRFLSHHDRILSKFLPKLHKHFSKHSLDAILYSIKWFFVIFVERIPFSLCLRIWDIYMIEGERVVTAMAFTILRIHRKKLMNMRDMDEMTEFLQINLHKNFGYDDDFVIKVLEQSMGDLRKYKMDLPPPPQECELPKYEFGRFIEPEFDTKVGRRKTKFTDVERKTTETVIHRQEENAQSDMVSNYSYDNTVDRIEIILNDNCSSVARTSIESTSEWGSISSPLPTNRI